MATLRKLKGSQTKVESDVPAGAIVKASDKPMELTKVEKVEANKRYKEKLSEFKEREKEHNRSELLLKYDYGEFVADVFDDPRKYGSHAAEELAKDMSSHPDTIRLLHRFYMRYSRETVENKLVPQNVPWSTVQALVSVDDPKLRGILETKAIKEKMTREDVRDEVKRVNEEAKSQAAALGNTKDRRGGLHDTAAFRNCENAALEMIKKLQQYLDACDNMKSITDPDKLTKLNDYQSRVKEALTEVVGLLNRALKL